MMLNIVLAILALLFYWLAKASTVIAADHERKALILSDPARRAFGNTQEILTAAVRKELGHQQFSLGAAVLFFALAIALSVFVVVRIFFYGH